jgi:hypothetical protein
MSEIETYELKNDDTCWCNLTAENLLQAQPGPSLKKFNKM